MKIAVDWDDTFFRTVEDQYLSLVNTYEIDYHGHYPNSKPWVKEDITHWGLDEVFGLNDAVIQELFDRVDYNKVFPYNGATDTLIWLVREGHDIVFLTHNPHVGKISKRKDEFRFLRDVHVINVKDKAEYCRDFDVGIIIDDKPETLIACAKLGIHTVRFRQPWNEMVGWGGAWNEHSCYGWQCVGQLLKRIIRYTELDERGWAINKEAAKPLIDIEYEPVVVNDNGAKQSKIEGRFDLLPMRAVAEVAKVLETGADRYGVDNWRGLSTREILNHVYYHLGRYLEDEQHIDAGEELSHAATRCLMALEVWLTEEFGE